MLFAICQDIHIVQLPYSMDGNRVGANTTQGTWLLIIWIKFQHFVLVHAKMLPMVNDYSAALIIWDHIVSVSQK